MSEEKTRHEKLRTKLLIMKIVLILSTVLFVLCLVYFVFYLVVMFYNRSYINQLNGKSKEMNYSQKISSFDNSYFIIDFTSGGDEDSPILRQVQVDTSSAFIVNDILKGNEQENSKNMQKNYNSLNKFCLSRSSQLMPLPNLNKKRRRFLNKKPSFMVKLASFLRLHPIYKKFDKFYNDILNFNSNEAYKNEFFILRVTENYINVVQTMKNDKNDVLVAFNNVVFPGYSCKNLFTILVGELAGNK